MGLRITASLMSSTSTPHTAALTGVTDGWEQWQVTWLPGRVLDRNQAVSAMMIAQAAGGSLEPGDLRFLHVQGWAAELGLAPAEAVMLASRPPAGMPQ